MKEEKEGGDQLREELKRLRQRISELEQTKTKCKRVEETLEQRATQLQTISEVGQQITSLLELDSLLDRIVNLIRAAFNYRYVTILLVDPATGELALRAGAGYEVKPAKAPRLKVGEEGICGWVVASGGPLLVRDVSQEPRYYPLGVLVDTCSELAVPIQAKGHLIGVLDVQSAELEAFDENDLFTLQTLADQVGVAIENAELFKETEHLKTFNESIVQSVAEAILIEDAKGQITFANPAMETLLDYTSQDLVGRHWTTIVPEGEIEKVHAELTQRLEGTEGRYEMVLLSKKGERVPVIVSSRPLFEAGRFVGVLSVFTDITERKQAEEALRLRFVNLAETVSHIFSLRDPYVATHQHGTAKLTRAVGEKMGLNEQRLQALYIGSLLHDIGKVAIPEGILRKPGRLNEEEWELVRTHPQRGYDILKGANLPWPVAELALHHHERLDGSGYPDGLKGDELSKEVRILAVCNVVDAMSRHHPIGLLAANKR